MNSLLVEAAPKIDAVTGNFGGLHIAKNQFAGEGATIEMLSTALANQVGRAVADRTGLVGSFNFKLNWTPDETIPPNGGDSVSTLDQGGSSIFTAIREQLGLELRATKGRAEVLVVDHVEHPSAN